MAALDLRLWDILSPHPKQLQFLLSPARFNLFLAGMGSGKTWSLAVQALRLALRNPGCPGILAGRVWPDIEDTLLPEIMALLDSIQRETGVNLIVRHEKKTQKLVLLNGAEIWLRSYDKPQRLLGRTVAWVCLDELEFSVSPSDQVLSVINSRVRAKRARFRQIAIATSPNGLTPLVQLFRQAQESGNPDYTLTTCTTMDNPHLTDDYIRGLKSQMSARAWRQNVLGEILRPQDVVFPEFSTASHVVPFTRNNNNPVVLGVDWGQNHAAAILIEVDQSMGTWTVFDELLGEGVNRDKWRHMLLQWLSEHKLYTRGTGASERLRYMGVDRAVPGENNWLSSTVRSRYTEIRWCKSKGQQYKPNQIEMIRSMLEPAEGPPLLLFADTLSQDESRDTWPILPSVQRYHYRRRLDGNLDTHPVKDDKTDHIVDALCYAIVAAWNDPAMHGGVLRTFESAWQRAGERGDTE